MVQGFLHCTSDLLRQLNPVKQSQLLAQGSAQQHRRAGSCTMCLHTTQLCSGLLSRRGITKGASAIAAFLVSLKCRAICRADQRGITKGRQQCAPCV